MTTHQSKIEKIIAELCPNGVEFKVLDEVCEVKTGGDTPKNYKKGQLEPSGQFPYPVYSNGTVTYGHSDTYKIDKDAVTISSIGNVGFVAYRKAKFTPIIRLKVLIAKIDLLDTRFLFYVVSAINFVGTNASLSSMKAADVKKYKIPLPPLAIQKEIVRILDAFTELTAELTARKKQYNYYRDQLLTFEEGEVEWKALGEVSNIQRGASPRPIAKYITDDNNGIPWIRIKDTSSGSKYVNGTAQKITAEGAEKSRILKKGDFIISNSMSFGRPYILNIDGAIHDGWASISDFGKELNPNYLYHYLSSNGVQNYWLGKINSGSVSNLNVGIIKNLRLAIPSPAEQARIVSILDKFDTLTHSISEGLPREIALRQKQYAYYRDLLLNFPKSEAI